MQMRQQATKKTDKKFDTFKTNQKAKSKLYE